MELKELKTYVKHIFDLEASVYQQTQMAEKIESEIARLPQKPTLDEQRFAKQKKLARVILVVGFVVGLLLICRGVINYHNETYAYFYRRSLRDPNYTIPSDEWYGWLYFSTGYFVLDLIPFVLCTFLSGMIRCSLRYTNNTYQLQLDAYIRGEKLRQAWQTELDAIYAKLNSTKAVLQEFYNAPAEDDDHYIHPDFRNLIAVSSIYQFLDRRQETTLPTCYTHFETAVFQHKVISKMDELKQGLDRLSVNQEQLYRAIMRSNEINEDLHADLMALNEKSGETNQYLNDINKSTRLMAHNSELERQETERCRFLEALKNTD